LKPSTIPDEADAKESRRYQLRPNPNHEPANNGNQSQTRPAGESNIHPFPLVLQSKKYGAKGYYTSG
jgi:hypothetical protein